MAASDAVFFPRADLVEAAQKRSRRQRNFFLSSTPEETEFVSFFMMDVDQDPTAAAQAARQVRVQLTSKQEDIALPENTGPILVPTGKHSLSQIA